MDLQRSRKAQCVGRRSPNAVARSNPGPALFAICLLLDYSQYLFASIVWRLYARSREKEFDREGVPIDQDFSHPNWLTWLYTPFFWLKVAALGVGQAILIAYLMRQWLP